MKRISIFLLLFCFSFLTAQTKVTYTAGDGLPITANFYENQGADTFIILFHQAGWSRGEYLEVAPKLNKIGYSCLAVDLRSGGKVNGVLNETNKAAKQNSKPTNFKDAFQDIEATVDYVKKMYKPKKIILWGSSYSSALVLKYAGDYPDAINAVLSFSPGEYFGIKNYITTSAKNIKVPVFVTSAKNEERSWKYIFAAIPGKTKKSYLPQTKGNHGSRALWEKFDDHKGYWEAVTNFLKTI